ncbi:restriction endonuclease [Thermomonas fusca]|uniref:restriction endonuclease n=1 Tax=Thermomonas fusca TaxID=215690 RepID=UPI0009FF17AF|nr:restriction endonuclease [Thermomonas fusca]
MTEKERNRIYSSVGIGWSSAGIRDSVEATVTRAAPPPAGVLLTAIVSRTGEVTDGSVIEVLDPAWREISRIIQHNPRELLSLTPNQWEELVAASYDKAGFDEVILTPRSGDFGRDVIAVKHGWGSIRIIDQVKAFQPGHLVTANDVRALLGVLQSDRNATKGIVTTTSDFAPRIKDDPFISPFCPFRLELVNGQELFGRLSKLGPAGAT